MCRKSALALMNILVVIICCSSVFAQQFSADLVRLQPKDAAPAQMFVNGDKMRLQPQPPERGAIVIVDLKQQTGFMVLPDNKTYMALQPGGISPTMPLFHPSDPEDACPLMEQITKMPKTCAKAGDEMVNGRAAVKYHGKLRNGDEGSLWIDRKLSFVVKWQGQTSAAELRNIREGSQPAALFEIPKDYQKMDAHAAKQEAATKKNSRGQPPPSPNYRKN